MKQVTHAAAPVRVTPAPAPSLARKCGCGTRTDGQCKSCEDEKKGMLHRKATRGGELRDGIPDLVSEELRAPGQPLGAATRSFMESRFGHDFSDVRVHVGARAAASASAVGAQAYTVGNHIVFGAGQYLPHTETGRQLLAHELTHTLQQRGMPSVPVSSMPVSHHADSSEREADAVATSVLSGNVTAPPMATAAPPRIARAGAPEPDPNAEKKKILKEAHSIEEIPGIPPEVVEKGLLWFDVKKAFPIPAQKGPQGQALFDRVTRETTSGLLMAAETTGRRKRMIKAAREGDLPVMWREKLNWPVAEAERLWIESAAKVVPPVTAPAFARTDKETCQFDHIMELQMGGPDVGDNLATVGGKNNRDAAALIGSEIVARVKAVADAYNDPNAPVTITQVGLRYSAAEQVGSDCDICCQIDAQARLRKQAPANVPADQEVVPLKWNAFTQEAIVPKDTAVEAPLTGQSAQRLVPGFMLQTLNRKSKKATEHFVSAIVETERMPIGFTKGQAMQFRFGPDQKLVLKTPKLLPEFGVKGLSAAKVKKISVNGKGLYAVGAIESSLSILNNVPLSFILTPDSLSAEIAPSAKGRTIRPIAGVQLVKPVLSIPIFPEFKPVGTATIIVGANYIKGALAMGVEGAELFATATGQAKAPGLDATDVTITYRAVTGWSGTATLSSSKIPFIKSASVTIGMSDKGVDAGGKIEVQPKGLKNPIELEIQRGKDGALVYKGDGILDLPRLRPIKINVVYGGGRNLFASGTAPFELLGAKGTLSVVYDKGAFTGSLDTFTFKKGRATVTLRKVMFKDGKFSGAGEIMMPLGTRFIAKGTVALDEQENLAISAALRIAEPIPLFEPIKGSHEFFSVEVSIPIPGANFGGVGLEARIAGSLSAGYAIGPAVLQEAELAAGVDPLQEGGPSVSLKARLVMPAKASITGTIEGGVAFDILVAEVAGGVRLTAEAALLAMSSVEAGVIYTPQRLSVDGRLDAAIKLLIDVALRAFVRAKAGFTDYFSVTTEKVWDLARWSFNPGATLSVTAKIHYDSDQAFQMPTLTFNEPSIDTDRLLKGSFATAEPTAKEREL